MHCHATSASRRRPRATHAVRMQEQDRNRTTAFTAFRISACAAATAAAAYVDGRTCQTAMIDGATLWQSAYGIIDMDEAALKPRKGGSSRRFIRSIVTSHDAALSDLIRSGCCSGTAFQKQIPRQAMPSRSHFACTTASSSVPKNAQDIYGEKNGLFAGMGGYLFILLRNLALIGAVSFLCGLLS